MVLLITIALLNVLIGMFFIAKGIERHGKENYFKKFGYYYGLWVIISTMMILYQATRY